MFDSSLIFYIAGGIVVSRIAIIFLEASISYLLSKYRYKKQSTDLKEFLERLEQIQSEEPEKPVAKKTTAKKKTTTTA